MNFQLAIQAELETRRRKREKKILTAPDPWDEWLTTLFPAYFDKPFADRHVEMWEWLESIVPGISPQPYFAIWPRGGGKSQNAEAGIIKLGAMKKRHYAWYVSSIQDKADQHVDTIGTMLESSKVNKYYPELSDRALGKFGNSKGWRRSRIRTASGFTIDALGLDTGARGSKIDEHRPDIIVIDDVDESEDSPATTLKKMRILSRTILPAGSNDCVILFIQNLITPDSIASRLLDGRADFLTDKIISGPFPAIENMEYEQKQGKFIITAGNPTWEGQNLEICQIQIVRWGFTSFMQEAQHDVDKQGGIWDHIDFQHVKYQDLPDFVRTSVWVDPAITSTDESDSMGISAGGVTNDETVIGLYWWEDITTPEDAIERAIRKAIEIGSMTVGIETDQGGDTWESVYIRALENVKKAMARELSRDEYKQIQWPRFISVKAGGTDEKTGHAYGSKVERNAKMLAAYENGLVKHMSGTHKVIEKALSRFPRKPLDVADSWFWTWDDLANHQPLDWKNAEGLGKAKEIRRRFTDE